MARSSMTRGASEKLGYNCPIMGHEACNQGEPVVSEQRAPIRTGMLGETGTLSETCQQVHKTLM